MKKRVNLIFVFICALAVFIPFLKTQKGGDVSADENRYLASMPQVFNEDGNWNKEYFEQWNQYMDDNIGFRDQMLQVNGYIQWNVFHNFENKDEILGKGDELFYATDAMLVDYQRGNLRNEEWLDSIAEDYQTVSDYVESRSMQFYYMQCFDKHSIYPELFSEKVNQYGDKSKTDQIMESLRNNTTINLVSCKETLLSHKETERTFSHFGDASHWNPYGAHLGYLELMKKINENNQNKYKVLEDEDYHIRLEDQGRTINKAVHVEDMIKTYTLKEKNAVQVEEENWKNYGQDERHRKFYNRDADNDTKLLIVGDSYINSFIIEDIAQSFKETYMIWGEYLQDLPEILRWYDPDIVVIECAERADRNHRVEQLAERIRNENLIN